MNAPAAGNAVPIVLGRILGAWGVQGWIRIKSFGDEDGGLLEQTAWRLRHDGAAREVEVLEAKPHGGDIVARLAGIADRTEAERLRGWDVTIERSQLPEPEAGEYYWSDLIGLLVRNPRGVELGRVEGLIAAPAHDVLRVKTPANAEQLIPFVAPIVVAVDPAGGTVTVEWEADY